MAAVKNTTVELTLIESALTGAVLFCFAIQLYFSLFVHLKLLTVRVEDIPESTQNPLSVIICARNEAENLERFLALILEQDYPDFEVIVVNDRSWDATGEVLKAFSLQYKNLKIVKVSDGEKFIAGKKFALTMGIKAASNEWLVFTDADCSPASNKWLAGMQQGTAEETAIVLGYSPYTGSKGLLNSLIRFETFFTAINYLAFALKGMPYMGVGRNMAYKRSLFFKQKGFAAHMHIPSGDDDLFVNANATASNTEIRIHPDAQVWSVPNTTWKGYLRQKKRHFGAGKFYKPSHQFILSMQIIAQFLFYTLLIALCFFKTGIWIAGGVFLISLLIRSLIYPPLLKRLNYPGLRWWFPVLDILLFIFLVINGILSIFIKKVTWK